MMGQVQRGLDVIQAVERLIALEGLEAYGRADPNYLVVVGEAAWKALAAWGTDIGLHVEPAPDAQDRLLGYRLVMDRHQRPGQVRLALVVGEAQGVPDA